MSERKPEGQRQGRGTVDLGKLMPYEGPVPAPPKRDNGQNISLEVQKQWVDLWQSGVATAIQVQDRPALERMFRIRDQVHVLNEEAMLKPLVKGSQEQMVLNPLFGLVTKLLGHLMSMEKEFGLTPYARMKLGITISEAGKAAHTLQTLNAEFEDGS